MSIAGARQYRSVFSSDGGFMRPLPATVIWSSQSTKSQVTTGQKAAAVTRTNASGSRRLTERGRAMEALCQFVLDGAVHAGFAAEVDARLVVDLDARGGGRPDPVEVAEAPEVGESDEEDAEE